MNDSYEKILEARNIKPTAMRILVLKALSGQDHAIDLNELEFLFDQADRVTLYRTLKTFLSKKLIHHIDDGTGSIKYALCREDCDCGPEDTHVHFHCNYCGNTYCMDYVRVPPLLLPEKFYVEEISIVLKGKCEHCN